MQTLNLTNIEKSDIKYEIFHFPDGEVHIKLDVIDRKNEVNVICRITNAEELFILMQVGDILNRQSVKWFLTIYYLMSMRMDRVITFNESFSLKVVTDMINSLHPCLIKVIHPHSERTIELLNCFVECSLHPNYKDFEGDVQLCYPDKGAMERYSESYRSNYPVLIGEKIRNLNTGKIESIVIKNPEDYKHLPVMVIDDLCDAGGTFLGINKAIKEIDDKAKVSISIIHMVNERGIDNLSRTFDYVYFTNSYKNWNNLPDNCIMFDVDCLFEELT